jgi:hypothetical protein
MQPSWVHGALMQDTCIQEGRVQVQIMYLREPAFLRPAFCMQPACACGSKTEPRCRAFFTTVARSACIQTQILCRNAGTCVTRMQIFGPARTACENLGPARGCRSKFWACIRMHAACKMQVQNASRILKSVRTHACTQPARGARPAFLPVSGRNAHFCQGLSIKKQSLPQ